MSRPDMSGERKNHILNAAAAVFARKGFHQARMDDIVQEAGLSKGTIYWYFKSKDDIIMVLVDQVLGQEVAYIEAMLQDDSFSVSERLQHMTQRFAADTLEMTDLLPLFYEFYAHAARHEQVRPLIRGYLERFRELLVPLIQEGIDRGEFRPVDPAETVIIYTALFEGLILVWTIGLDREQVDLAALAQQAVNTMLTGLQTSTASPSRV